MMQWDQIGKSREKWDKRFIQLAYCVRGWSKDKNGVGAVLVNPDRRIISTGYNGFPKKLVDDVKRLESKGQKRDLTIHAELNALLNAVSDTERSTIYVTRYPCHECMKPLIQKGIIRIASPRPNLEHEFWGPSQALAWEFMTEAGIEFTERE